MSKGQYLDPNWIGGRSPKPNYRNAAFYETEIPLQVIQTPPELLANGCVLAYKVATQEEWEAARARYKARKEEQRGFSGGASPLEQEVIVLYPPSRRISTFATM